MKKYIAIFLFAFITPQFAIASNFLDIKLSRGVNLQLPKGWWVLGGELNQAIETSVEAAMDLSGIKHVTGKEVTLLRANSMPRSTYAAVGITSITPASTLPNEILAMSGLDLQATQTEMHKNLNIALSQHGGGQIINFYGLRRDSISGHPALVTTYRRSGPKGPVLVTLLQIFTPNQEISINLSYRESEESLWKPVITYIRKSLTIRREI